MELQEFDELVYTSAKNKGWAIVASSCPDNQPLKKAVQDMGMGLFPEKNYPDLVLEAVQFDSRQKHFLRGCVEECESFDGRPNKRVVAYDCGDNTQEARWLFAPDHFEADPNWSTKDEETVIPRKAFEPYEKNVPELAEELGLKESFPSFLQHIMRTLYGLEGQLVFVKEGLSPLDSGTFGRKLFFLAYEGSPVWMRERFSALSFLDQNRTSFFFALSNRWEGFTNTFSLDHPGDLEGDPIERLMFEKMAEQMLSGQEAWREIYGKMPKNYPQDLARQGKKNYEAAVWYCAQELGCFGKMLEINKEKCLDLLAEQLKRLSGEDGQVLDRLLAMDYGELKKESFCQFMDFYMEWFMDFQIKQEELKKKAENLVLVLFENAYVTDEEYWEKKINQMKHSEEGLYYGILLNGDPKEFTFLEALYEEESKASLGDFADQCRRYHLTFGQQWIRKKIWNRIEEAKSPGKDLIPLKEDRQLKSLWTDEIKKFWDKRYWDVYLAQIPDFEYDGELKEAWNDAVRNNAPDEVIKALAQRFADEAENRNYEGDISFYRAMSRKLGERRFEGLSEIRKALDVCIRRMADREEQEKKDRIFRRYEGMTMENFLNYRTREDEELWVQMLLERVNRRKEYCKNGRTLENFIQMINLYKDRNPELYNALWEGAAGMYRNVPGALKELKAFYQLVYGYYLDEQYWREPWTLTDIQVFPAYYQACMAQEMNFGPYIPVFFKNTGCMPARYFNCYRIFREKGDYCKELYGILKNHRGGESEELLRLIRGELSNSPRLQELRQLSEMLKAAWTGEDAFRFLTDTAANEDEKRRIEEIFGKTSSDQNKDQKRERKRNRKEQSIETEQPKLTIVQPEEAKEDRVGSILIHTLGCMIAAMILSGTFLAFHLLAESKFLITGILLAVAAVYCLALYLVNRKEEYITYRDMMAVAAFTALFLVICIWVI